MSNFIDIDVTLKPGIVASVEVEFEISSGGVSGDNLDPPELDMYEITGLSINNVVCSSAWYKLRWHLIQDECRDDMLMLIRPLLDDEYYYEWQRLADRELSTEPSAL